MMDLVGLPLTSIILFILAGILIGHSFWYQDRSEDLKKINWLEKRYLQARQIVRRRRLEQRHLQMTRDQQQLEVGTLRQRHESTLVQFKGLERTSQATAAELEALRAQHQQTSEQYADELRRNELLVTQLQEVLQTKTNLEHELEQQSETLAKLTDAVQNKTPELESLVHSLRTQLNQSRDAMKQAGEDLSARSSDLDVVRTQRDTLKQELEVSHQNACQVEETLTRQEIQLTGVREQLEELLPLRAESVEASLTIAEQRLDLAAKQEEVETLRALPTGYEDANESSDHADIANRTTDSAGDQPSNTGTSERRAA